MNLPDFNQVVNLSIKLLDIEVLDWALPFSDLTFEILDETNYHLIILYSEEADDYATIFSTASIISILRRHQRI
jgi:hypothetical protein